MPIVDGDVAVERTIDDWSTAAAVVKTDASTPRHELDPDTVVDRSEVVLEWQVGAIPDLAESGN